LVTVLFTDLVDSTRLANELGPAAADELRRAHFQSLREVIATHEGREVKNTGDGLMVAFDRPSDGAACAVDLQRRTERFGRHSPDRRLAIRIGLAVGEATSEDGDWFGPPVVEAARLCSVADPGQILATEVVRVLSGGRGGLDFVGRGPMALKGLPDPVAVVEIAWAPEPAEISLPPLLASLGGPFFVGRDLEAETLLSAWKESLEGKRRAVLVAGEPGVGKTRLVHELAVRAQEGGATILYGRCDEELGLAYQPFVEALAYLVSTCERDVLDRHVAVFGGELTRIVSELSHRVAGVPEPLRADPEIERHRLFEAVAHLLTIADDGEGVVLILDDLHWADKGSLLLLRHLLRVGDPMALLLIGTYRDTDLARTHPLAEMLADFRRQDDVDRLMLSGLDVAGVEAFVEAAAGQRLNEDGMSLARAVHGETEGNPFFVGQVLRHLAETGAIFQREGQWSFEGDVAHLGIPEGVREVIGRRLNRLPEDVNRVLRTAAVIGREFDLRLAAEVDDVTEDDVVDALEAAVEARLVSEVPSKPDHFMFAHALVRESLYDELSTSRRTRLHKRIGEALERRPQPPLAALAHHFCEAAAMGDVDKAAEYAGRAGDEALAALAHDDARTHFGRGIDVLDEAGVRSGSTRVELLLGLAEARDRAGEIEDARHLAETAAAVARDLDDPELFGRAALKTGVGVPSMVNETGAQLVAEALERLDLGDSALRSLLLSRLARATVGPLHHARRRELSAEALAIARRVGDERTLVEALATHHDASWEPANVEERLALADEMVEVESSQATSFGHVYRWGDYYELGDIDGTRHALAAYEAHGLRTRERGAVTWTQLWHTSLDLFAGRLADAETKLMGWFADHRGINEDLALASFGVQFFALRRDQGRCEEVEPPIRALAEEHPENAGWRCGLAMLMTELDRAEEALALFEGLAADGFVVATEDPVGFTLNVSLLAETCAYLRDGERAALLYDRLAPYAGRNIVVGFGQAAIGAATRYIGLLAATMEQWDEAESHFEDALAMNERMGARPWLARTAYDYARMLQIAGRPARIPELTARASALAEDIGMPVLARRVAALRA
jgi:class 3 adenylate cyclase